MAVEDPRRPPIQPGDVDDEVAHHLEMRARELIAEGWEEDAARAEARRRFGDVRDIKRAVRRQDRLADRRSRLRQWLEETVGDVRIGARRLARTPMFAALAVLTLALGIGANSALFSVINTVVLQPLPFPHPDRLVQVWESAPNRGWDFFSMSEPNYLDYRDSARGLDRLAAASFGSLNLTGDGDPERLDAYPITANLLETLGVEPVHGRAFSADEDRPGEPARVVILGYDLWQRRFGADPRLVGDTIVLDDAAYLVVGVAPRLRPLLTDDAVFVPLGASRRHSRGDHRLEVFGRLSPAVTAEHAEEDLDAVAVRLARAYPDSNAGFDTRVVPLYESVVPDEIRSALYVLLGSVGLVLLIACANLSNLLLARATRRQRELAVYGALGASRGRVVRQLVTESILVSLVGGGLGVALAYRATGFLRGVDTVRIPRIDQVAVDGTVLAFTLAMSLLAGLLAGAVPALRATGGHLVEHLKEGGRGGADGQRTHRMRRGLMIAEVALSVVLLAGAGLLLRSFWLVQSVDPGLDVDRLLAMELSVPIPGDDLRPVVAKYRTLLEEVRAVPAVDNAATISALPFGGGSTVMDFFTEDHPGAADGVVPQAYWRLVSPGYFATAGIELLRGRLFDAGDDLDGPNIAVVSRTMAERHWPGEDPVGKRFLGWRDAERPITVVGVVDDVRERNLETEADNIVYLPFYKNPWWADMFLIVRTQGDPASLAPAVRAAIRRVDPSLPVAFVQPVTDVVADTLGSRRLNATLLGAFAAIALLLAAAGVYGVISYGVAQRAGEIGVRMALGARAGQVVRLVVRQGMTSVIIGAAIGLAAALLVTRLLASQLYGITASDPWSFAAAALFLSLIALVACLAPALRAARIDPMDTLRDG